MKISWHEQFWNNAKYVLLPWGCVGLFGIFLFLLMAGNQIVSAQSKCPVVLEACQASYYLGKQQGFMGPSCA